MTTLRAVRVALSATSSVAALVVCSPAYAESCNPDFGDQIYRWVDTRVESQSRRLAETDYNARALNFYMMSGDDFDRRIEVIAEKLKTLAAKLDANEGVVDQDPIKAAVQRDRSATQLLNALYEIRAAIDELKRRRTKLDHAPTEVEFSILGLGNVGRATLLESLQQLGDARLQSLSARYSVSFSMSFDENGQMTSAEAKPMNGDYADGIVSMGTGIAYGYGWVSGPVGAAIVTAYAMGRMIYESEVCRKKVEAQEQRWKDALALMPSKLIKSDSRSSSIKVHSKSLIRRSGHTYRHWINQSRQLRISGGSFLHTMQRGNRQHRVSLQPQK